MGNALRFLYRQCCSQPPTTTADTDAPLGYHGVSSSTVSVSVLAQHLYHFEITNQVPEGLSAHVVSSKKAQSNWYTKLAKAWRESNPPPKTPEEAAVLILHTLHRHQKSDLQGLLTFYGLPIPYLADEPSTTNEAPLVEDGLKFELYTLPVDGKAVPDGDGVNVYVSTTDARNADLELKDLKEVQKAAIGRSLARAQRNYTLADALHKQIIDKGYRVLNINNEEILARKYRIRLRGIDAPENEMPYGKEAKDELVKIVDGKCLQIQVFGMDRYDRFVADVYCNGLFVQKRMLKKGLAWHYTAYDRRPQLAKWEKEARAKGIGLWALPNPEMPWEWRQNHRENRY